jgi:hypothetical protein
MQVNCLDSPFQESNSRSSQKQNRLPSPRNGRTHWHNPKIGFQSPQITTHIRRDLYNTNKKSKGLPFRSHHINRCNFTQFCAILSYSLQFLSKPFKARFSENSLKNPLNATSHTLHKKNVNPANPKIDPQKPLQIQTQKVVTNLPLKTKKKEIN